MFIFKLKNHNTLLPGFRNLSFLMSVSSFQKLVTGHSASVVKSHPTFKITKALLKSI